MPNAVDEALLAQVQVGAIEHVYTLESSRRASMSIMGFLALLLLIFSWATAPQFGWGLIGLWALFFLIGGIWIYAVSNMRVYLCADGLLEVHQDERQSIRWTDVSQVDRYAIPSGPTVVYFTTRDGRRLSFHQPDSATPFYQSLEAKGAEYHFPVIRH